MGEDRENLASLTCLTAPTPDFGGGERAERERRGIRGVTACPIENDSVQSQYLLVDSEK
jgi:hypothetical protein